MIQTYKNFLVDLQGFPLFVVLLFGAIYLIRMLYLFLFTGRILFRKKQKNVNESSGPLSIFLTIRNDEENLKANLPGILTIDGIEYEVIVVDDYSQDNSYLVLGSLRKEFAKLKISTLNEDTRFSIKLAQNIAIKAAKNEWVLNIPVSLNHNGAEWLSGFSNALKEDKTVVLGYSGIESFPNFFNHLYRVENYFNFMKSVGFTLNNLPLVYSEENVAFRKNEYFRMGGYGQRIIEPFANLELLINSFIRRNSTSILFSKQNSIQKKSKISRSDYFDLLKKNIRIEKHLSLTKRISLFVEELTRLLFLPLLFFVIILLPDVWIIFATLIGIKITAHLFIIKITQKRLNERKIFISSLVYDVLMPYFKLVYRWFFNHRSRKNKWSKI